MCHMGSDRVLRVRASRLVEELRDEWDAIHNSVVDIECPFQQELDANGNETLWCNPRNTSNCIEHCLANVSKCKTYMDAKDEVNRAMRFMTTLLEEHRIEYVEREGDTNAPSESE